MFSAAIPGTYRIAMLRISQLWIRCSRSTGKRSRPSSKPPGRRKTSTLWPLTQTWMLSWRWAPGFSLSPHGCLAGVMGLEQTHLGRHRRAFHLKIDCEQPVHEESLGSDHFNPSLYIYIFFKLTNSHVTTHMCPSFCLFFALSWNAWHVVSSQYMLKNMNAIKEPPLVIPTLGSGKCLHLEKQKKMTARDPGKWSLVGLVLHPGKF